MNRSGRERVDLGLHMKTCSHRLPELNTAVTVMILSNVILADALSAEGWATWGSLSVLMC